MNFYPHHIGDFNNSTRHLTRVERSVYRDAIEFYYDTESALTLDIDRLYRKLICQSDEEKNAINAVLDEFFLKTKDGYTHKRCDIEIAKYRSNTNAKARAGIASAAKRKHNSTHVEHTLDECSTNQEPVTSNQEPRTKNQEPIKKTKATPVSPAFVLPDWIDADDWSLWLKTRKGKKMIPEQMQAQVKKLQAWKDAGMDYGLALKNSATNGWIGLFEPKLETQGKKPATSRHDEFMKKLHSVCETGGENERDITSTSTRLD